MQFSRYRSRYQDGCYDLADLPPLDDAAHVWSKDLTRGDDFHDMEHLLSADELQRANRFRFARDRDRYVIGRAWLRRVLAAYLRQAPADLVITYGPQGKPQLAVPAAAAITFNASGSLGRALLAVSTVRQIGVDIELVRAIKDAPALAKRHFSADESRALQSLQPDAVSAQLMSRSFLIAWTRKEAVVKALGIGLNDQLSGVQTGIELHDQIVDSSVFDAGVPRLWLSSWQDEAHAVMSLAATAPLSQTILIDAPGAERHP